MLKLIIIHGAGGTYADALATLGGMLDLRPEWRDGAYLLDHRTGRVARQILNEPDPSPLLQSLQKLAVGRLLVATRTRTPGAREPGDQYAISEEVLQRGFAHLGIPWALESRVRRGKELLSESTRELSEITQILDTASHALKRTDELVSEAAARDSLLGVATGRWRGDEVLGTLERFREMSESGGDVDTVTSAALYAQWIHGQRKDAGATAVYGRDYRYVFINYHERLDPLGAYGPAELLMADLPIAAFPHFDDDARALAAQGVKIARFEDHHPYTPDHRQMLEKLVEDGVVGHLCLSGPLQGEELPAGTEKCAADMVYESVVANRSWDTPGTRTVRETAHGEDFVTDRSDLGRVMTDLIKGGFCKVELAQLVQESFERDDAMHRIETSGLKAMTEGWKSELEVEQAGLCEHAYVLSVKRPEQNAEVCGGPSMGAGSDVPVPVPAEPGMGSHDLKILVSLAVSSKPGKPRMSVGKAIEYYARVFPDVDYAFYSYGCRLMVARRLNQADTALNLGDLMPRIGGEGDGGHGGAAVCRPDSNPGFPSRRLGSVDGSNFRHYVRYLGAKLEASGYAVTAAVNRSVAAQDDLRKSGTRLAVVTLVAVLIGLMLVIFHDDFSRKAIERSNSDFLSHLKGTREDALPREAEGDGASQK
ncbi:MAG: hypothetical protein O2923_00820 [Verrucomicrobia bacterium]|nr:hypothetical protein [Verrucomicrobiota bacterium]MDA1086125.1 hypothetical protein [Verrucomicrobiota bacterium]